MKLVNCATAMRVPASRWSTMPIDEASIVQAAKPCATKVAKVACSSTASGVVRPVDSNASDGSPGFGGSPTPSVPITPQRWPSAPNACAVHQATEVLPLVPVTATTSSVRLG